MDHFNFVQTKLKPFVKSRFGEDWEDILQGFLLKCVEEGTFNRTDIINQKYFFERSVLNYGLNYRKRRENFVYMADVSNEDGDEDSFQNLLLRSEENFFEPSIEDLVLSRELPNVIMERIGSIFSKKERKLFHHLLQTSMLDWETSRDFLAHKLDIPRNRVKVVIHGCKRKLKKFGKEKILVDFLQKVY